MKKLFLISTFAFALMSVALAAQDLNVIKFYDSKTYFDGHVGGHIAYDHNQDKVYFVSVDTKDANHYRYFLRVLENGQWKQINTPELNYPYGDTLRIKGIEVDKQSRIWLTTPYGFLKYENAKWEMIQSEDIEGLKEKSFEAVIPDSLGNVFFQVCYGYKYPSGITQIMRMNLYKYMPEGNKLSYSCDSANYVDNPEHLGSITERAYCADDQGNIWLASVQKYNPENFKPKKKGLMRYNDNEGKYEFFEMKNLSDNQNSIIPQQLLFDKGNIWLVNGWSYAGGISKMNMQTKEWELFDHFDLQTDNCVAALHRLESMVTDGDSLFWGITNGWGLLKFDLKEKLISLVSFADMLNRKDLGYQVDDIYNSFKDRDGNNWFVAFGGLIKTEGKKTSAQESIAIHVAKVSPNPASDYISISGVEKNTGDRIDIYSQLGVKFLEFSVDSDRIDISKLPAGVYVLKAGGQAVKFVKI